MNLFESNVNSVDAINIEARIYWGNIYFLHVQEESSGLICEHCELDLDLWIDTL
jgi:hypothetical protein